MANRLKLILPELVSVTQATFIQGRLISDNILVAHKLVHALNSMNKCSEEHLAIKTDISKAFDRFEWSFLRDSLTVLGFSNSWINLIMSCVESVQYQVLIKGIPYGDIKPTRGIRQGDPLSPYLFILCSEMLVRMLQQAEGEGKITGLKIPMDRRETIKSLTGITEEGGDGFYLGLPEAFGGSKIASLNYLKERFSQKISGWQHHFLSLGGKEVLLKAVAMALPTHAMTCFKVPKAICQQMISIMADFWWANKKDSRGMHWKSWEQLSKPKQEGGLGFKDIEAFKIALLGKQLWRMLTKPNTLMARVFKSRFSVRDLMVVSRKGWKRDILDLLFSEEDMSLMEDLRPSGKNRSDGYAWDYARTGNYSVKSGYWVLTQVIQARKGLQEVNQLSLNPLIHQEESINHLLFQCSYARQVWAISPISAPQGGEWVDLLYTNMYYVLNIKSQHPQLEGLDIIVPWLLWRIWKARNDYIYGGKDFDTSETLTKALEDVEEWRTRKEHEEHKE
ncbi:PREDICTED: uncharacterized protein LOC104710431 [Camelina sativa]|uniref:Uncharacterized protein LOC104710431 n=1 Tax=Camelina sativa TaxID=90675 RepID=A0ABM0TEU0_CAMSA|nr:PREDICTED: uncharacterized protein LOC104710431 [Camelina sativa]